MSNELFDATTVDPETAELAAAGTAMRGKSNKYMSHQEDVNEDGFIDQVLQVATQNLAPESLQDGYATLTAKTYDGIPNSQAILVACKRRSKFKNGSPPVK